jgi:hypothetical protein
MADVDCRPQTLNLYLYAGDDVSVRLTVTDEAGDPVDLSGGVLRAEVRTYPSDAVVCEATVGDELAADGVVYVSFTGVDTADMADGRGLRWDLEHDDGGLVETLCAGIVHVDPDVTRVEVEP